MAEYVGEGNFHAVLRYPTCLNPSTILTRAARTEGSNPARSPTASAAATCMASVSGVTWNTGNIEPIAFLKTAVPGNVAGVPRAPPRTAIAPGTPDMHGPANAAPQPT